VAMLGQKIFNYRINIFEVKSPERIKLILIVKYQNVVEELWVVARWETTRRAKFNSEP
jgi:hypothetical protein